MTTTSGLAGILSFIFVVLMTLGFLRSIYLTRDGFFADEEDEDENRNDHSLSGQTPEEFRRHQEADMEVGMGGRRGRRRLREEEEEDLEGLFWDVELVFPARRQNRRQRRRDTVPDNSDNNAMAATAAAAAANGNPVDVPVGNGRRRFRLSELLFRRDAPAAAAAPPRTAGFPPGDFSQGGNPVQQETGQGPGTGVRGGGGRRGEQGSGALDPLTRKTFIHFVAKAGDGFAPPPAGGGAAAALATSAPPSAMVAASLAEQEVAGAGAGAGTGTGAHGLRPPDGDPRRRPSSSSGSQQPCNEEETKDGLVGERSLNTHPSQRPPPPVPSDVDGGYPAGGWGRGADNASPLEAGGGSGRGEHEEWKDGEQPSAAAAAEDAAEDARTTQETPSSALSESRPACPVRVEESSSPGGRPGAISHPPRNTDTENRAGGGNARGGEPGAPAAGSFVTQGQARGASPGQTEARLEHRGEQKEEKEEEEEKGESGGRHDTPGPGAGAGAGAGAGGSEPGGGRAPLNREEDGAPQARDEGGAEDDGMLQARNVVGGASLAAGATTAGAAASIHPADAHESAEPLGGAGNAAAPGAAAGAGAAGVTPETAERRGMVRGAQGGGRADVSGGDAVGAASDRRPGSLRLSFNRALEGKKLPACLRRRRRGSSIACPVCLDVFQEQDVITLVTCGHAFHWKCVEPWLERNARCPCCRQDLNALTANLFKSTEQGSAGPLHHPHLGGAGSSSSSSSNNNNSNSSNNTSGGGGGGGGWLLLQQQEHQRPPHPSEIPPPPPPPPLPPPADRQADSPVVLDQVVSTTAIPSLSS